MNLIEGMQFGRYRVESVLGKGGMGVVHKAFDTLLKRFVALKVLPEEFALDPERLRRFELEATAISRLNHPNVVAIYDMGSEQGCPYLVCEFVAGRR